jgi:hypothetical protein
MSLEKKIAQIRQLVQEFLDENSFDLTQNERSEAKDLLATLAVVKTFPQLAAVLLALPGVIKNADEQETDAHSDAGFTEPSSPDSTESVLSPVSSSDSLIDDGYGTHSDSSSDCPDSPDISNTSLDDLLASILSGTPAEPASRLKAFLVSNYAPDVDKIIHLDPEIGFTDLVRDVTGIPFPSILLRAVEDFADILPRLALNDVPTGNLEQVIADLNKAELLTQSNFALLLAYAGDEKSVAIIVQGIQKQQNFSDILRQLPVPANVDAKSPETSVDTVTMALDAKSSDITVKMAPLPKSRDDMQIWDRTLPNFEPEDQSSTFNKLASLVSNLDLALVHATAASKTQIQQELEAVCTRYTAPKPKYASSCTTVSSPS